jgi:hypothetical protein
LYWPLREPLDRVTVIVTKQTRTPPRPAKTRRSRVPEINALLARCERFEDLTRWQRGILAEYGLGHELAPTRKRRPKVSSRAKVVLLLWELRYRYWIAEAPSEGPTRHELLLRAGHPQAAAELNTLPWDEWLEKYGPEHAALFRSFDLAIESDHVVNVRGARYAIGERKHNREKYERLRRELGDSFIGTFDVTARDPRGSSHLDLGHPLVDRAARVRQWDKRRRERVARAKAAQ